jgi:hypothetical protein
MRHGLGFAAGFALGILVAVLSVGVLGGPASARQEVPDRSDPRDNPELIKLYEEDQADRQPKDGKAIDWAVVGPRDRQREARVKALYEAGKLRAGGDYYRAAMVLQHASKPEDYLLAHEFCVVAASKGERNARWLAAATEDRYLMNIGRPQRFGTQYRSTMPDEPVRLHEVAPGVTDGLRRELGVPTLAEAREREAQMNEGLGGKVTSSAKP